MKMTICKYCQGEGEGTWLQYMEWTLEVNIYKIVSSGERIFVKKYVLSYEGAASFIQFIYFSLSKGKGFYDKYVLSIFHDLLVTSTHQVQPNICSEQLVFFILCQWESWKIMGNHGRSSFPKKIFRCKRCRYKKNKALHLRRQM